MDPFDLLTHIIHGGTEMIMMASWNGNAFRITGPLWGGSIGWFPSKRASNTDLWWFFLASDTDLWGFFYVSLNKLLNKHSSGRRCDTPGPMWRHCNEYDWPKAIVVTAMRGKLVDPKTHYGDVIMTMLASQITSLTVVYSIVYSGVNQRKHQSSASLAFVWGIHRDRWIPHTKGQLRGKCFHLMTSSWQQNTTEHEKTWTPSIILRLYFIQGQPLFSSSKTLPILIQIQRNSSTTLWRDDRHH